MFVINLSLDNVTWETIWPHTRTKIKKSNLYCLTCQRGFIVIAAYERHIQTHKCEPFKCTKCSFKTHTKTLINSHNKIHLGDFKYSNIVSMLMREISCVRFATKHLTVIAI